MAIIKNAISFGSGFNITAAGPIDSRMRVPKLADLTTVWGTDAPHYAGMTVVVNEENQAYILKTDGFNETTGAPIAADPTVLSNWVKSGLDFSDDINNIRDSISDVYDDINTVVGNPGRGLTGGFNSVEGTYSKLQVAISNSEYNTLTDYEQVYDEDTGRSGNVLFVGKHAIVKESTPEDGYAATYKLVSYDHEGNATQVGASINIIKDQFLKSATFHTEKEADAPAEVVAPYIKFVWNIDIDPDTSGEQNTTYVPVSDLVDTYTGDGVYISVGNDGKITLDKSKLSADLKSDFGIDGINNNITNLQNAIANVPISSVNTEAAHGVALTVSDDKKLGLSVDTRTLVKDMELLTTDITLRMMIGDGNLEDKNLHTYLASQHDKVVALDTTLNTPDTGVVARLEAVETLIGDPTDEDKTATMLSRLNALEELVTGGEGGEGGSEDQTLLQKVNQNTLDITTLKATVYGSNGSSTTSGLVYDVNILKGDVTKTGSVDYKIAEALTWTAL